MTTRNLVPRGNNEGSLGIEGQRWAALHSASISTDTLKVTSIKLKSNDNLSLFTNGSGIDNITVNSEGQFLIQLKSDLLTGLGFNEDAIYSPDTSAQYISTATSLKDADSKLAAQISLNVTNVNTIQSELDVTQDSAGINADGSFTAPTGTNYLSAITTLKGGLQTLDTQIKSNEDAISSLGSGNITALENEIDAIEASVGLDADGTFTANSGGNYIQSASSVRGEINALDTQVATNAGDISNLSSTVSTITSGSSANATDIANLQSEVDATQAGAGLGITGAYAANSGSNYITGATSLKDADNKLDAQIKTNADAIALKAAASDVSSLTTRVGDNESDISTLQSDVSTNTSNIASNLSAIQSNDSDISSLQSGKADASTVTSLQAEVDATQASAGINANGSFTAPTGTNYLGSITTLKGGLQTLDSQIKTNEDAIASNDTDIATNASGISSNTAQINVVEASVGLAADGTYSAISGANYATSSSSLKAAVGQLDTQAKANADAITSEASTRASAISTVNSSISSLQSEVDASQTGAGLNSDGGYTADSATNYLSAASSLKDADIKLDAQVKTNADALALKASASDLTTLTGRVTANEGDISSVEADVATNTAAIATNLSSIQSNDSDISGLDSRLTTAEGEIDTLQTESLDYESRISTLEGGASVSAVQAELDATQAGAGLNTDGSYSAINAANYASSSTSLKAAVQQLDTQLGTTQGDLDSAETAITSLQSDVSGKASTSSVSALQSEVDAVESSVGINSDGTFTANSGGNYIQTASSVRGEINALDTQVAVNAGDIGNLSATVSTITSGSSSNATDIANLQSEVDTTQTGAGLGSTGAYAADSGTNYITGATSLKDADNKLDAQIKTNADAIALKAAASDVSSLTTRVGDNESDIATLQSDVSTNTSDIASNLSAIQSNDSDISSLQSGKADASTVSALQTEVDATQAGAGLNANGTLTAPTSSNYLGSITTLKGGLQALDTQIKTNVDAISSNDTDIATNASGISTNASQINTVEASVGLATDGSYSAISGANYATSSSNLKAAVEQLDTQVKTNADAIATETTNRSSAISTVNSSISTLQSEVDATQTGAGLNADGSYTANTGANYISSSTSLKDADNDLDTQIKSNADDIATLQSDVSSLATSSNLSALQSEVDAIESGVGLSTAGAYVSRSGTNYLDSATSIVGEISALDTQLASTQSDLDTAEASLATAQSDISDLETLADTHETSIGLNADGSYTAISGNYATASSLRGAVSQLDTQAKVNADAIALKASSSDLSTLQTEVDGIETAVGLSASGAFVGHSGTNYIDAGTTVKGVDALLDAAIKARQDNIDTEASTRASADNTLTTAINTVEASVGLQSDGSLSITGTNYLNSASSIVSALDILDTNQKLLVDVQANIRSSAGLSTDGTKTAYSSTNYISGSLKAAIEALDTQVASNASSISSLGSSNIAALQTEIDDTQAGVGLDSNGDYVARSGTNYLDSATNVVGEITALDTQVKSNADAIALRATSADLTTAEGRITEIEKRDGGLFIDNVDDDAVEMDDTISQFKAHAGPFQFNLASLISTGTVDLVFYGDSAPINSDKNFDVIGDGNVAFTGV